MLKKIIRNIRPNPLDSLLKKALKNGDKRFLLGWNRGLGDIPLGLFALVQRIKWFIPGAEITFMIRKSLSDGFLLFPYVKTMVDESWERGKPYSVKDSLKKMKDEGFLNGIEFDVIIEKPDPAYWLNFQLGRVMPILKWRENLDPLAEEFKEYFSDKYKYVAVQIQSDTSHSPWRDWPEDKWQKFFDLLDKKKNIKAVLFGIDKKVSFKNKCIVDLRGRTTILQALSVIKNKCRFAVLPDGGILSLLYYLDAKFPIKVVSLWGDVQGVLKQNVESPNDLLNHRSIFVENRDLSIISPEEVFKVLFERSGS